MAKLGAPRPPGQLGNNETGVKFEDVAGVSALGEAEHAA